MNILQRIERKIGMEKEMLEIKKKLDNLIKKQMQDLSCIDELKNRNLQW